jgi:hypothetical protein
MKKKLFKSLLIGCLLVGPSFISQNTAKADVISDIAKIADSITHLICPEVVQDRCKGGECMDGACISFRKACKTNDDCVKKK